MSLSSPEVSQRHCLLIVGKFARSRNVRRLLSSQVLISARRQVLAVLPGDLRAFAVFLVLGLPLSRTSQQPRGPFGNLSTGKRSITASQVVNSVLPGVGILSNLSKAKRSFCLAAQQVRGPCVILLRCSAPGLSVKPEPRGPSLHNQVGEVIELRSLKPLHSQEVLFCQTSQQPRGPCVKTSQQPRGPCLL